MLPKRGLVNARVRKAFLFPSIAPCTQCDSAASGILEEEIQSESFSLFAEIGWLGGALMGDACGRA